MEIWCILNIVAAYIPLIGRMRDNFNAKHVLSVLYDERYLGRRLSGYLEWLDQEIPSIARKISAGRYERYLICEDYRERRNMVFRVGRDQLHSDARHLVKQAYLKEYHASHPTMQACYEDVYRSTKPRWKPFQYWLDEASGLWRVSRLPLSAN